MADEATHALAAAARAGGRSNCPATVPPAQSNRNHLPATEKGARALPTPPNQHKPTMSMSVRFQPSSAALYTLLRSHSQEQRARGHNDTSATEYDPQFMALNFPGLRSRIATCQQTQTQSQSQTQSQTQTQTQTQTQSQTPPTFEAQARRIGNSQQKIITQRQKLIEMIHAKTQLLETSPTPMHTCTPNSNRLATNHQHQEPPPPSTTTTTTRRQRGKGRKRKKTDEQEEQQQSEQKTPSPTKGKKQKTTCPFCNGNHQQTQCDKLATMIKQRQERAAANERAEREKERRAKKVPCTFYDKGRCDKGQQCSFSHDFQPAVAATLCSFYLKQACEKGDACPFSHDLKRVPCRYFFTVGCNVAHCRFSHDTLDQGREEYLKDDLMIRFQRYQHKLQRQQAQQEQQVQQDKHFEANASEAALSLEAASRTAMAIASSPAIGTAGTATAAPTTPATPTTPIPSLESILMSMPQGYGLIAGGDTQTPSASPPHRVPLHSEGGTSSNFIFNNSSSSATPAAAAPTAYSSTALTGSSPLAKTVHTVHSTPTRTASVPTAAPPATAAAADKRIMTRAMRQALQKAQGATASYKLDALDEPTTAASLLLFSHPSHNHPGIATHSNATNGDADDYVVMTSAQLLSSQQATAAATEAGAGVAVAVADPDATVLSGYMGPNCKVIEKQASLMLQVTQAINKGGRQLAPYRTTATATATSSDEPAPPT